MTTSKERPIFPQLSGPYLRALGELMICQVRLQALVPVAQEGPRWRTATEDVLKRASALTDMLATGPLAERALRVQAEDGSFVAADIMYVHRLIRHLNYQIGAAETGIGQSVATGPLSRQTLAS